MAFYVVLAYDIDNTQRTLIHEAIKARSENWWHQWEDCWLVETDDEMAVLSERLLPFASIEGSEMLILAVKDSPGGRWSARLGKGRADWLIQNMNTDARSLPSGQPPADDPWAKPAKPADDPWAKPAKPAEPAADPWGEPGVGSDEPPF